LVEARQQLREGLVWPTLQHGQGVVTIGSHRHTAHRIEYAHGDFAIGDQGGDVRQIRMDGIAGAGIVS
jgi:hypothetical protein